MSVKTIVCGSFGKKDVEDTIGERVVAALRPQRLWMPWCRLVCRTLHVAPWMSCLPLHLSCASIPSQSFLWPIPHFFHHLLFIGLYNSQKKNKSWSVSCNRLQSHAAARFVLQGFEPERRRIRICTLYTDMVVYMGGKSESHQLACVLFEFRF